MKIKATNKSNKWELINSWWIILTFYLLGWVAFLYIGKKAKNQKWIHAGLGYFLLFGIFMLSTGVGGLFTVIGVLCFYASWIMPIIHGFKVRKEYLRIIAKTSNEPDVITLEQKDNDITATIPEQPVIEEPHVEVTNQVEKTNQTEEVKKEEKETHFHFFDQVYLNNQRIAELAEEFIAIDFETTGLSRYSDRPVQVGLARFKKGKLTDTYESYIDPERPMSMEASRVNGIYDWDLEGAPSEADICQKIIDFIGNDAMQGNIILTAYNARFDMGFLYQMFERQKAPDCSIKFIDTWDASEMMYMDLENYKLNTVAQKLGITNRNAHTAQADAEVCGEILADIIACKELFRGSICTEKNFSEKQKDIGLHIQKILQSKGLDINLLRFHTYKTNGVIADCLYPFIFFKCNKSASFFVIPKDIADKNNLKTVPCVASEGANNVRFIINELSDIDDIAEYIVNKYQENYAKAKQFIEARPIHEEYANDTINSGVIFSN